MKKLEHILKFLALLAGMYGLTYVPGGIWVNAAVVVWALWRLTK